MCIIVISEKKPLKLASFVDFHAHNQDGAGIMTAHDGKVHTHVSLDGPSAMYTQYMQMYREGVPMFLHYRMKTHGKIDLDNTHPYLVYRWENGKELWMMHNGVLTTGNKTNPDMSDTWHFIQERLQELSRDYPKWFMNVELLEWLGKFIGNNRFVLLDSDGDYGIVNYQQWTEYDDHLYSNTYAWDFPRPKVTYPARGGYYQGGTRLVNGVWTWDDDDMGFEKGKFVNGIWVPEKTAATTPPAGEKKSLTLVKNEPADKSRSTALDNVPLALLAEYDQYMVMINRALPNYARGTFSALGIVNLESVFDLDDFLAGLAINFYSEDALNKIIELCNSNIDDADMLMLDGLLHDGLPDEDATVPENLFDTDGFDSDGFDAAGFDAAGYNAAGMHRSDLPVTSV